MQIKLIMVRGLVLKPRHKKATWLTFKLSVTCPVLAHVSEVKLFTLATKTGWNKGAHVDAFPAILTG